MDYQASGLVTRPLSDIVHGTKMFHFDVLSLRMSEVADEGVDTRGGFAYVLNILKGVRSCVWL